MPECGSDFEVITKSPLELNPVDEYDDDDEEDNAKNEEEDGDF